MGRVTWQFGSKKHTSTKYCACNVSMIRSIQTTGSDSVFVQPLKDSWQSVFCSNSLLSNRLHGIEVKQHAAPPAFAHLALWALLVLQPFAVLSLIDRHGSFDAPAAAKERSEHETLSACTRAKAAQASASVTVLERMLALSLSPHQPESLT